MTIHASHPFPTPEDPVRRLRARLGGQVSLWTAGHGPARAGLTVSSLMVASGEPARVLALIGGDSELGEALESTGRGVVQLLHWQHRTLADQFAGVAPAPGGPFRAAEFEQTPWGPRLVDAPTWAGVALESIVPVGWSALATCLVESLEVGDDSDPLIHRRGRYSR